MLAAGYRPLPHAPLITGPADHRPQITGHRSLTDRSDRELDATDLQRVPGSQRRAPHLATVDIGAVGAAEIFDVETIMAVHTEAAMQA